MRNMQMQKQQLARAVGRETCHSHHGPCGIQKKILFIHGNPSCHSSTASCRLMWPTLLRCASSIHWRMPSRQGSTSSKGGDGVVGALFSSDVSAPCLLFFLLFFLLALRDTTPPSAEGHRNSLSSSRAGVCARTVQATSCVGSSFCSRAWARCRCRKRWRSPMAWGMEELHPLPMIFFAALLSWRKPIDDIAFLDSLFGPSTGKGEIEDGEGRVRDLHSVPERRHSRGHVCLWARVAIERVSVFASNVTQLPFTAFCSKQKRGEKRGKEERRSEQREEGKGGKRRETRQEGRREGDKSREGKRGTARGMREAKCQDKGKEKR